MRVPKHGSPYPSLHFPIDIPSALEHHPHTSLRPPPHPSLPSSTTSIAIVLHHAGAPTRPRRPLLEMDVSHPRRRTNSLASRPLASSASSSSLPGPLTRPSLPPQRDLSPDAPVYHRRSASTPRTSIAPPMPTRRRKRGGTSYLLNFLISTRK